MDLKDYGRRSPLARKPWKYYQFGSLGTLLIVRTTFGIQLHTPLRKSGNFQKLWAIKRKDHWTRQSKDYLTTSLSGSVVVYSRRHTITHHINTVPTDPVFWAKETTLFIHTHLHHFNCRGTTKKHIFFSFFVENTFGKEIIQFCM